MKRIIKFLLVSFAFLFVFLLNQSGLQAEGRDTITDWYIKTYNTEITVNDDSSLDITENIVADCGNLTGKHGIFRIVPTGYYPEKGKFVSTPIELISITDFQNQSHKFETINNKSDHTLTWKIGDPNKEVRGENQYRIKYHVKNTIRFTNDNFDEFYWNLNGNYWDLETDSFSAVVKFPDAISEENSTLNVYSGFLGEKNPDVSYKWIAPNKLEVTSTKMLYTGEGITLSITFPKNIISPYKPSFAEKYGSYFFLLIPLFIIIFCYLLWNKFGRDPKINPTVVPEFEIPENLAPMELGMVYSDGLLRNEFISAALIQLAVKKIIKIEEFQKGKIFKSKDYKLILLDNKVGINDNEQQLLDKVFSGQKEIEISSLKNVFYKKIPGITSKLKNDLKDKKLLIPRSRTLQQVYIALAILFIIIAGYSLAVNNWLAVSLFVSALIVFVFSFLMPQRTLEGLKLYKRILGLKMYMEKAEKYRQRFNEKENIFEKFLPYAIVFGMTNLWIKKMQEIYGKEYFNNYMPYWYVGHSFQSFNVDNINSAISGMSSSMASTMASSPSSSGSGGGGFSGGGGGGGGGGGW